MSVYMHMYIYICIVGRIKIQRHIYIYKWGFRPGTVPKHLSSRHPKTRVSRLVQRPLLSASRSFEVDPIRPARETRHPSSNVLSPQHQQTNGGAHRHT